MRDKKGNYLTTKQYFKRWGEGIKNITPYQQSKVMYQNTYIMLFGILAGVIFTFFNFGNLWWLSIILIAAFVNTVIVQLGNWQKYLLLKTLEASIKEVEK